MTTTTWAIPGLPALRMWPHGACISFPASGESHISFLSFPDVPKIDKRLIEE